MKLVNYTTSDC